MRQICFFERPLFKKLFVVLMTFFVTHGITAQFYLPNPTVPAPNIAGGKQNLEVSNDLYNGRINVSIPVYNYEFEGIQIPINLTYTSSNGIKPDELPGWVGSGWNLQGSGYVHRTVRGRPDEAREFKTKMYWFYYNEVYDENIDDHPFPEIETTQLSTDYAYFLNTNKLNVSNWFTQANATAMSSGQSNLASPVLFNEAEGYDHRTYNDNPVYDLVPDEYSFSMGGISGKFYKNHENEWLVQANDGKKYDVYVELGEQVVIDFPSANIENGRTYYKIPRIIKYITLTSTDGIKYVFGNTNLNASFQNAMFDYSRTSEIWDGIFNSQPPNPRIPGAEAPTLMDIVPHTWHLTQIENLKTGSIITFTYKWQLQFYTTKQAYGVGGSQSGSQGGYFTYTNNDNLSYVDLNENFIPLRLSAVTRIMTRSYTLTGINFPNGVKIDFKSTASNQLSTNRNVYDYDNCGFYSYWDIFLIHGWNNTLQQLNNIAISYNNQIKKEIDFSYALSASQRLQLAAVKEKGGAGTFTQEHKFQYNTTYSLPDYGSTKSDHWGFYNGQDFFANFAAPFNFTKLSSYNSFRDPDANYAQAEILTKVIYPTGGSIQFEYEAHSYSKKRDAGFLITNVGSNQTAGGVRIKKISYRLGNNDLAYEKLYEYNIPGSSLSSGVLAIPPSRYLSGDATLWFFQAAGYSPIYYEGNNVAYTFATEKQVGNGKTEYEFTNYDNGFNDAGPKEIHETSPYEFKQAYVRNAFKRGKQIHIKVYNESRVVQETDLHYEHENNENNKPELRTLYLYVNSAADYYGAVSERVYPDRFISQEVRTIEDYGAFLQKNSVVHDEYGNIVETITVDSKGKKIREKTKFCYEYAVNGTDDASLGIKKLNDLKIKSFPVETITIRENIDGSDPFVIAGSLYTYKPQSPFIASQFKMDVSVPIPFATFPWSSVSNGNFVKHPGYGVPELTYKNHDSKGNILQVNARSGIKEGAQWGYNQMYLVARASNASNLSPGDVKEFFYQGFEENSSPVAPIAPYAGNNCVAGDYVVPFVKPNSRNYLVDYRYLDGASWKYIRKIFANNMVLAEGSAIDEVRVYPENSQIVTYTYSPLIGLTSETDVNGRTKFYDYDQHGRLSLVSDENRNILKKICYNYVGEPVDCYQAYGNDALAGSYLRDNCGENSAGEDVPYLVPAGAFVSFISKADANKKASNELLSKAQNYANQHGACIPIVYAKLVYGTATYHLLEEEGGQKYEEVRADMYLAFFSDAACTNSASVTGLELSVNLDPASFENGAGGQQHMTVECNGTTTLVAENVAVRRQYTFWNATTETWQLLSQQNMNHAIQESRFIRIVP